MTKVLLFKVDGGGNLISYSFDKIIARENHVNVIRVESPLPADTTVYANIDVRQSQSKTRSVYLKNTGEVTQDGWNVFEGELKAPIIEYISRHRAMPIGLSLSFSNRVMPKLATEFKGYFNLDSLLPITANEGEFYIAKGGIFNDEFYYEFTDKNIEWLKGDIAFWYDGKWRKSNYKMVANMSTVDIAVEGSVGTNKLVEDNDPLILVLAGDIAEFREEIEGFRQEIDEKLKDVIFEDSESVEFNDDRIDDELFIEANVKEQFIKTKAREELQPDITALETGKAKKPTHFEDENIETIYVVKDDGEETRAKGSKGIVNDAYVKRDNSGKVLVEDGASGKEAINYSQFEPLESGKEDKSNKATDFSVIDNNKYPTTKAVKTETDKKVNKTQTIIGIDLQDNILIGEFKTALGNATSLTSGLMTSQDKIHLDNLVSLLDTNDMNSVVDTIGEILQIFENYPEGANILEALNDKVDKIQGKGLSENDYTDIDKNKVNLSYTHREIVDGSNPHNTKFVNIADKPTTRDGYGITDVYTKPETYTQLEINNLLDNLSAVKGIKSTLLTPTELSNGNTIATNLLTNNGAFVVFTATDTSTGEIDSDTVPVSTIKTGKKFVFFDNQEIVFTIGETNSIFETSEDITLKINLLFLDSENVQAVGVEFDGSLTNYLENQENVQSAINKLDEELKTTNDNKVDKVTGKGLSTEDYTTTEKNKLSGIEAGAKVNVQSDWTQEVNTADDYIKNKPAIPTKTSDLTNDTGYITGYTETDPIFTAWDKSTGISITKSQITDLIEATQAISGLMSATDKQRLDTLHALLEEDEANNVVDSINEVLAIFNNYPEGADLVSSLANKVDKVVGKGLSTNDFTDTLKSNYDTAYSWGDHAVEGYLKAITKTMVEAVLTGTITSHNHSGIYEPANSNIQSHISSTSNPHSVTKAQVGLSNVDDTSDLDKPISTAQQTALNNKVDKVAGKGLSTEDYTTTEKNKLAGLTVEIPVESWDMPIKTLALSDSNKLFRCSWSSDQILTIPTNATVPFPIGTMVTFLLLGTSTVLFAGESGVTLTSMDGLVELKTQYAMASLIKIAENLWQLVGALE